MTLKETVAHVWPAVSSGLRQPDIARRREVEIRIANLSPMIDAVAVADAIADKIIADGFAKTRTLRLRFVFPGARR